MTNNKKRVATLYRVSTKGQLDGNDIPMQERACKEYIKNKEDWVLVKEYVEKGVSGFKVAASKRDIIQHAKEDAENGVFDILLVFMFDRLGRRDDETPFVLEWFVNQGIEMWSVVEGQQKIEQHTDRLINYIRFWQSSGESRKTSERVTEKHKQMVQDGIFRGGGIPYGYSAIESGLVNKKGKRLLKLIINEEESNVIKKIFELAHDEGYGQLRIAKYLNETAKVLTRNGKRWSASTINTILKNPIYKGVMRYRSKKGNIFSDEISELKIIETKIFEEVQKLRKQKNPNSSENKEKSVIMNSKGKLLLIGFSYCGHCGSRFISTTFTNKYRNAKGEMKKYGTSMSYRCSGKLQNKTKCKGQSTYSANKIEKIVLEYTRHILNLLERIDYKEQINKLNNLYIEQDKKEQRQITNKIESLRKELSILNSEVTKAILGKSSFKPEILNNLIETKNEEILTYELKLSEITENANAKRQEIKEINKFQETIPVWRDVFNGINTEKKKIVLSKIYDKIYISKNEIKFKLNLQLEELLNGYFPSETSNSALPPNLVTQVKL